jgi:hypothetical protein
MLSFESLASLLPTRFILDIHSRRRRGDCNDQFRRRPASRCWTMMATPLTPANTNIKARQESIPIAEFLSSPQERRDLLAGGSPRYVADRFLERDRPTGPTDRPLDNSFLSLLLGFLFWSDDSRFSPNSELPVIAVGAWCLVAPISSLQSNINHEDEQCRLCPHLNHPE